LDEKNGLYYDGEGNNIEFIGYETDFQELIKNVKLEESA
jgi:hypothetical protein